MVKFWLNDLTSTALVTLCVVLLIGTNNVHVMDEGQVQSVVAELKLSGIRKLQKRNVSTSRRCSKRWSVALKSATLETLVACAGPVTDSCRTAVRETSPL